MEVSAVEQRASSREVIRLPKLSGLLLYFSEIKGKRFRETDTLQREAMAISVLAPTLIGGQLL